MITNLTHSIVRIVDSAEETFGTGFVLTNDGLIATCAHVVNTSLGRKDAPDRPDETIHLIFHPTDSKATATVESDGWRAPGVEDIAILRLNGPLPQGVTPLPLGHSDGTANHAFETFGFPDANSVGGLVGGGQILGQTILNGVRVLQLRSQEVTGGFSGAPVWDQATRRVVGMVTATAEPDRRWRLAETAFITPTETLREVCPALRLSDICPYQGLTAFTETEAEFFFGRERVVDRLLDSLRYKSSRFLAVLGPSGSGKSSLVQAGLIPQLRRGAVRDSHRWGIITIRPAENPFAQLINQGLKGCEENLSGAVQAWLARYPQWTQLMLVVDPFEELMTACPDFLRQAFVTQLTALLEAPPPITVVLAMRDDFYSRFAQQTPALTRWLEGGLVNAPPGLEQAELMAMVQKPAQVVGLRFEEGLADLMVRDAIETIPSSAETRRVSSGNTVLPLLEFALTQLWDKRREGVLTHSDYKDIGGVTGALTQWADNAYFALKPELRPLAQHVLTDLVYLGDEAQGLHDSRRRKLLTALYRDESTQEAIHQVVQQLASARLLVTGRDLQSRQETVELIHDALLREWATMRQWLTDDRRFLAWRQEIERRAEAWRATDPGNPTRRDGGKLLRGGDLAEAGRWLTGRSADLGQLVREFILTSRDLAERVRWRITLSLAIGLLITSLLALVAWSQRNTAVAESQVRATAQTIAEVRRQEAVEQRQIALARQLAAQADLIRTQDANLLPRSVLLAAESLVHVPLLEGDQALRRGLALLPRLTAQLVHTPPDPSMYRHISSLRFSPDGRWLAAGSLDTTIYVWNTATWQESMKVTTAARSIIVPSVRALAFSSDSYWLATGSDSGLIQVWEVNTGHEVTRLNAEDRVFAVAFSPDGRQLVAGGQNVIQVWEVETGREVARINSGAEIMVFSPDGKLMASGGNGGKITVWEAATGKVVTEKVQIIPPQNAELKTSEEVMAFDTGLTAITFSPDSRLIASGEGYKTGVMTFPRLPRGGRILVWEANTGREVAQMKHVDEISSLDFSPDGRRVASGSLDGTARVWDVDTGLEISQQVHDGPVNTVAFIAEGRWVVSGSGDGTARVWAADTGREIARMATETEVNIEAMALNPTNNRQVAWGDENGKVWVWDILGPETLKMKHEGQIASVVFSPDGKLIATGSWDKTARVWNAATGQEVSRATFAERVSTVIFSQDGRYVASGSLTGTVKLWEATTGREVTQINPVAMVGSLAFSPNGRWLAVSQGSPPHYGWLIGLKPLSGPSPVTVWEIATGQEIAQLAHEGPVSSIAFSPDGRRLISGSDDRTARIWDVATGVEISRVYHKYRVNLVSFSPDGQWVASAEGCLLELNIQACHPAIKIWNPVTGKEFWQATLPGPWIPALVFSPDSHLIAAANIYITDCLPGPAICDNTVRVWEVATGREISRMTHDNLVISVVFSPDGRWLASGSADHTLRIWEATTGQEVARIPHDDEVWAAGFSPDGRWIASGGRDGDGQAFARIFPIWPEDLLNMACSRLARNLTRAEWQQYVGAEPYRRTCPNLPEPSKDSSLAEAASGSLDGSYEEPGFTHPSISADERYVVFTSAASNLVSGDTNRSLDVFVYNLQTKQISRVSVASDGMQGNDDSQAASISADGRYIAFRSTAVNLVSDDTNGLSDVFIHDRQTGQTTRVSVASDGTQGNGASESPSISPNGRYIIFGSVASNLVGDDTNEAYETFIHDRQTGQTNRLFFMANQALSTDMRYWVFASDASNLVSHDTNEAADIFVHDWQTEQTTRVSITSDGSESNRYGHSSNPSISADGRYVAFESEANNLVLDDTNDEDDVFVHDRWTGQTRRVSVASDGTQGNDDSKDPSISADGRYVVFRSEASNLVSDDTNNVRDIFIHDLQTGQTRRISVASDGVQGNGDAWAPAISAGRYVVFESEATNLANDDLKGHGSVFLHDLQTGQTTRIAIASDGD